MPHRLPFSARMISAAMIITASLVSLGAGPAVAKSAQDHPFRLCVIDQLALLRGAKVALDQAARFQQVRQEAQAKLDEDKRTLDADVRALGALRASIPAAAAATRKAELDNRAKQLVARADQLNRSLGQLDADLTNQTMKVAEPFIVQTQQARGCSLLSWKASWLSVNDPSLDITDELLTQMNGAPEAKGR
jgi:Skp family chaperone for outer membrane proteins